MGNGKKAWFQRLQTVPACEAFPYDLPESLYLIPMGDYKLVPPDVNKIVLRENVFNVIKVCHEEVFLQLIVNIGARCGNNERLQVCSFKLVV